jgi:hypothetical protein
MSILDEEEFHQEILVTFVINIRVSPHAFPTCIFCQSSYHQTNNCPYRSNQILPTQIVLTNHRPYLISLLVQSFVLNVQNLIYPSTPPNVTCRKPIILHVSIPFTKNVME